MNWLSRVAFIFIYLIGSLTQAACLPESNPKSSSLVQEDGLAILLKAAPKCPQNVMALRQLFIEKGFKIETTMVANEGFHNVAGGSYSFFEQASGRYQDLIINSGDLYFGHFTYLDEHGLLALDQVPENKKLMIELLAWDSKKGVFNFYELRGDGQTGHWFFRGDSWDIYLDNQNLHRQIDPNKPQFGARLRCSGCHSLGGPIMKELNEPHNDWWQANRPLLLQAFTWDEAFASVLNETQSASVLAQEVEKGTQRLFAHKSFKKQLNALSLQERLRPLFCPVEVNFKSDNYAQDKETLFVNIPIEFFIDKRFLPKDYPGGISISRKHYQHLLTEFASSFPNTQVIDSDHAWLTPIKAQSDIQFIDRLLADSLVDEKFIADVLAIDMTNPVFSARRCSLLGYIPKYTDNWREVLLKNLQQSLEPGAQELIHNMQNPQRTLGYYQEQAKLYLTHCQTKAGNQTQVKALYELLLQRRHEISTSEISKNPLGQILEPGFRVIFPNTNHQPQSGVRSLDLQCSVH